MSLYFIVHCPGNLPFLEYLFKKFEPPLSFLCPSRVSYPHIKSRKAKGYNHWLTLYRAYILQPLFLPPVYYNIYYSSTADPICFKLWSVCSHFLLLQLVPTILSLTITSPSSTQILFPTGVHTSRHLNFSTVRVGGVFSNEIK